MIEKNENEMILKEFCLKVEALVKEKDKLMENIEIRENNEKLKSLSEIKSIILASPDACYVREAVWEKIKNISLRLKDKGIGLHVSDGWRSSEKQKEYWDEEVRKIKREHPEIEDPEKIREIASRFVAPLEKGGHLTGGAVDVALYDLKTGKLLDMGYEEDDETPEKSYTDYPFLYATAKDNRQLLKSSFEKENFINIPTEWWHYSYGNAEWAVYKDEPYAFYGEVKGGV